MSAEENKALANRIVDEVWNKGNLNVVDEVYDTDAVIFPNSETGITRESGMTSDLGMTSGPKAIKQLVTKYRSAFSGLQVDVKDMIAKEDYVITRWRAEPGGLVVIGITIMRIANGKIKAEWSLWNTDLLPGDEKGVAVVRW